MILALFFAALAAGFGQFGAVSSLNDVAQHFGRHGAGTSLRSVVGLSGSVLGLGLASLRLASLASLPLASLADRRGRTGMLRVLLLAGLLATAGASLSFSYWFFVACFALARPLLSAASTIVQVVTVELSRLQRRMHRLVVMAAGAGIGAGLSAVLHGTIRGPNSFRWLFALAVVPLAFVPSIVRVIPEPASHSSDTPLAHLGMIPRPMRGRLTVVAITSFVIGMITGPANGFAFVYGEGVLKIAPHVVAGVVAVSALTGLAGLALSRHLAHRVGRRWTVAMGVVVSALTASVAYSGGKSSFIVGYLVGVAAAGLLAPAATALSTEIFAQSIRATAAGWVVVAGVLGATTGLFLFGFISDATHGAGVTSLRLAALLTFLPLTPTLLLLRQLPESSRLEVA